MGVSRFGGTLGPQEIYGDYMGFGVVFIWENRA